jgi:hypothetical protein
MPDEKERSFTCAFCGALAVVQASWEENVCPGCHEAGLDALPPGLQRAIAESRTAEKPHRELALGIARWLNSFPDVVTMVDLGANGGPPRAGCIVTGSDVQLAGFGPALVMNGEAKLYCQRVSEAVQEFFWKDHGE